MSERYVTALEELTDRIGFDLISKHNPKMIAILKACLAGGMTASEVEQEFTRFMGTSLTTSLIAGAVHYLENQHLGGGWPVGGYCAVCKNPFTLGDLAVLGADGNFRHETCSE